MVNNQIEFNNKFAKETKEVKIIYKKFVGELVVENYSELEKLQLLKVNKIEKLTLGNLTQLKECTIQGCGVVKIVIDNCFQMEKLNIKNNSLTSLDFLKNLDNLTELEIDGNIRLTELLKPYKNNWKAYQKDLQEIFELTTKQDYQELVKKFGELKQSREDLKKQISTLLKNQENFSVISKAINTKELVFNLGKEFQEKEEKIKYLELRARELTEASKIKKQTIIEAFVRLSPEKDLLQELIELHLEFIKTKKQKQPVIKLKRQKEKIYNELEKRLNDEEIMEKIETILTDCEQLIEQELELESKLTDKSALITNQKQNTQNAEERKIIEQNNQIHQKQLEEFETLKRQNSLIIKELKEIKSITQSQESLVNKVINQLKIQNNLTQVEQNEIINKLNELLAIKRMFINNRESVIDSLKKCCDILEQANIGKYAKNEEVAKSISAVGKLVGKWTIINIVEPVGDGISATNSRNKRKFAIENSHMFQQSLTEEEKNLTNFKEVYYSLVNSLNSLGLARETEPNLFSIRYKVYEVATNIWQNKAHLEAGDMKDAIASLQTNLLNLQDELQKQETLLSNLQKQQLQAQIQATNLFR